MNKKGTVLAINISEKKGVIKTPIEVGTFKEDHGLVGDAHAGNWHRQVSLLGDESIEKIRQMGIEGLGTGKFAENITTKDIVLYKIPEGTKFKLGYTIQEVTQIGKKCHAGCAIKNQVGDCVMPREGIFTKIIKGGEVRPGDTIEVIEE
ncbi:MAG: MOSC domain-containing protein [Paraclostridium bifermentans]